jgi:tRNA(Glu) U13 pseudouridine synthase TruD
VNLITPRLLPLLLSAYQSFLWNRIASRYLSTQVDAQERLEIAGERLSIHRALTLERQERLRHIAIPLPNHQAALRDPALARIVEEVLAQEGFRLGDMKARILQNAYLAKGERPLLLFPQEMSARPVPPHVVQASFLLPPGAYATLVIKAAAAAVA